jgi:hypothetical protein
MDRRIPGVELDDWSDLATGDLVSVVEPRMAAYQGWIDEKMPSSDIVWIRRSDLGSRHLIDRDDGVVIVREQHSHTCSSTGCAHGT